MSNVDYEIRVEETRGMRAVAKTGAWQNWERGFPKKFRRPESTEKLHWAEGKMVLDRWEARTTGDSKAYLW